MTTPATHIGIDSISVNMHLKRFVLPTAAINSSNQARWRHLGNTSLISSHLLYRPGGDLPRPLGGEPCRPP